MLNLLRFVTGHPLVQDRPLAGVARVLNWQLRSRLQDEVVIEWIGDAQLAVRRGMTGATGNIYCGLHETVDMAFVLHMLHPNDLFVDVGANVGSYTVLAGKLCQAQVVAFEPDPGTMQHLRRNIDINAIGDLVETHECALGAEDGRVRFTEGRDTMNQVIEGSVCGREVEMRTLDGILNMRAPVLMKIDVEGFEESVLQGGRRTLADPALLAIEVEGDSPEVRDILASAGFEEMIYDPFERSLAPANIGGARQAANGLYIRDVAGCRTRIADAPYHIVIGHRI